MASPQHIQAKTGYVTGVRSSKHNQEMLDMLVDQIVRRCLKNGWHGTAVIELSIKDGSIMRESSLNTTEKITLDKWQRQRKLSAG